MQVHLDRFKSRYWLQFKKYSQQVINVSVTGTFAVIFSQLDRLSQQQMLSPDKDGIPQIAKDQRVMKVRIRETKIDMCWSIELIAIFAHSFLILCKWKQLEAHSWTESLCNSRQNKGALKQINQHNFFKYQAKQLNKLFLITLYI